jgi:hypothetical protein
MSDEKCQVIFFPTLLVNSEQMTTRLDEIQMQFRQAIYSIEAQEIDNKYNSIIRKQTLANKLRELIHIVDENPGK